MPLSRLARPGFWVDCLVVAANRLSRRRGHTAGRVARPFTKAAAVAVATWGLSGTTAHAQTYTFDPTKSGTTQVWDTTASQ